MVSLKAGRQTQIGVIACCLQAFFLFGYDQGVFGGLVTNQDFLDTFNNPKPVELGFIVSTYNLGCIVGCALMFAVGAHFGRRHAIWAAMSFITVGAVIQASAYTVPQMMVGRVLTGIGVGIDTCTVPTYQSELCKASVRGRLVTTGVLFTAVGVAFAYFFSFALSYTGGVIGWRLPIALQIVFALPVMGLLFALPETPRWLMQQRRTDEAVAVMSQVWDMPAEDPYIQNEKTRIQETIALEEESAFRWVTIFKKDALQTRWRIFLSCLVMTMNQWSGISLAVFYASVVLEDSVGLPRQTALVVGGCLNLAFAVGSFVPSLGLDRLGRRWPMIIGCFCMGISMMLIAVLLSYKGTDKGTLMASVSVTFFFTYMLFYGASLNAIPWCYSVEILPLKIRARGAAIAILVYWCNVFMIVSIIPTLVARLHWKAYLIFMATNFACSPTIYFLFPETSGKSLEDIDYIFLEGHAPGSEFYETKSDESNQDVEKKTMPYEHVEQV